jgi:F-type H+-transporting ATPase subunit b
VISPHLQFAQASGAGLGAFNLNLKGFLFQLATFLIVLYVLRRYVTPKLIATLDQRQKTLRESLEHAKQTEEALAKAQQKAEEILSQARAQADEALAEAKKAAAAAISGAEAAAVERSGLIIKEAEAHLSQERAKLREELRKELAELVADATEKIIHEKLDPKKDMSLIERAIKGIAG